MIAMTTSSSMRVNAHLCLKGGRMGRTLAASWVACTLNFRRLKGLRGFRVYHIERGETSLAVTFTGTKKTKFIDFLLPRRMTVPVIAQCFNLSSISAHLPQLLRERALRAIGIVLHTKIFIDLEQALLVRDGFQKFVAARIVPEETRRRRFESSIRQLCRQP